MLRSYMVELVHKLGEVHCSNRLATLLEQDVPDIRGPRTSVMLFVVPVAHLHHRIGSAAGSISIGLTIRECCWQHKHWINNQGVLFGSYS